MCGSEIHVSHASVGTPPSDSTQPWGAMRSRCVTPRTSFWFETTKDGVVGGTVDIGAKAVCTIGRSSSCDVVLEHPSISRQHAVLLHTSTGYMLFDLGSIHGTSLVKDSLAGPSQPTSTANASENDSQGAHAGTRPTRQRLPKHEQVPLCEGQHVVFGASRKVFTLRCASSVRSDEVAESPRGVMPLELPPRKKMGVLSPIACGRERASPGGSDLASSTGVDTRLSQLTVPVKRKRSVTFNFPSPSELHGL